MNTLKSMFVVTVLAAVSYGVYLTITGKPDAPPPHEASGWDSAPHVQMPPLVEMPSGDGPGAESQSAARTLALSSGASTVAAQAAPGVLSEAPRHESPASSSLPPPFVSPSVGAPRTQTAAETQAASAASLETVDSSSAPPPSNRDSTYPIAPSPSDVTPVTNVAGEGDRGSVTNAVSTEQKSDFARSMDEAYALLDQNKLVEAHERLSTWYDDPRLDGTQYRQLADLLDQLAGTIIYSQQHLIEPAYVVQPGDTLEAIANKYGISWRLLAKINGLSNPQQIRIGDELKVIRGPFDASVNLTTYQLTLFLDGKYAGRFRMGLGRDQSTPEGEYTVVNKVENPTYYGIDRVIDADDPSNPLGERWIDLGNQLGIHGTDDPDSIGRADSRGCIRLSPSDIEDVYDILSLGSKVVIRR